MNIVELIEALADIHDVYGDDVDIRITNPDAWPSENDISGLLCSSIDPNENGEFESNGNRVVWLLEGK